MFQQDNESLLSPGAPHPRCPAQHTLSQLSDCLRTVMWLMERALLDSLETPRVSVPYCKPERRSMSTRGEPRRASLKETLLSVGTLCQQARQSAFSYWKAYQ